MQHGRARWPRGIDHVAVPVLASTTRSDRFAVLGDVGKFVDLRMLGEAVLGAVVVDLDITEAAGEGEPLGGRAALVTGHNDAASVERCPDLRGGSPIRRWCQSETG